MIFATVGTQLPFDRLLLALDGWAKGHRGVPVLAQTGDSSQHFSTIETVSHLGMVEFEARFAAASLIVAHAGMGTILSAAEIGKPILLMPRRADLNEHRNDHQKDTAREMARLSNVTIVEDETDLHCALDQALACEFAPMAMDVDVGADMLGPLIDEIRDFVWDEQAAETPTLSLKNSVA
ncbi:glycosyltransferase [Shimia sp.]|uniref:glycosyltransferase n=1 Tax=Shimia sp. TaxID=1954381 RepID=UPI0032970309